MTPEQMKEALQSKAEADKLRKQLRDYVLLKRDYESIKEVINVGDPERFAKDRYARLEVQIPEDARIYVFNLWRRKIALQYNSAVRRMAQLGLTSDHDLLDIEAISNGRKVK